MAEGVRINSRLVVPIEEIEITYARSGGPGGQNVNKVSSKAVLRFDLAGSPCVPEAARQRALSRLASRLTRRGEIVLSSDVHREQSRNRADVLERFAEILAAAVAVPKRRRPTRPSAAARERRLVEKKARGRIKRERQRTNDGD